MRCYAYEKTNLLIVLAGTCSYFSISDLFSFLFFPFYFSLQEPCFEGRHIEHMLWLTIPQLLLYVLGLPLTAAIIILRNKKHLHQKKFYTRYGLLYMGCTSFLLIHVYDILFIYTILHLVLTIFFTFFFLFPIFLSFPFLSYRSRRKRVVGSCNYNTKSSSCCYWYIWYLYGCSGSSSLCCTWYCIF